VPSPNEDLLELTLFLRIHVGIFRQKVRQGTQGRFRCVAVIGDGRRGLLLMAVVVDVAARGADGAGATRGDDAIFRSSSPPPSSGRRRRRRSADAGNSAVFGGRRGYGWSLDQRPVHLEHSVRRVELVASHEVVALIRAEQLSR